MIDEPVAPVHPVTINKTHFVFSVEKKNWCLEVIDFVISKHYVDYEMLFGGSFV